MVLVAMHAKTGRPGFMAHTFNLGTEVRLNGLWITESEAFGYAWGTVGVPVILVSGDDKLREDLATMPWIEYVEVKRAFDSHRAVARPVDQAHADLKAAASRAVRRLSAMRPMKLSIPVDVVVRAVPPASLAGLEGVPGVAYADSGVRFTAPDLEKAFAAAAVLVDLASELGSVWPAVVGAQPNAAQLERQAIDTSVIRAFDYNSGRWVTPVRPARTRRYHGSN